MTDDGDRVHHFFQKSHSERAKGREAGKSPPSRRQQEMDCWRRLISFVPRSESLPRNLLVVVLAYSSSSQFLPIEPYLVPYLTTVKNFSNHQVTVDIFPVGVYAQLMCTLLVVPACYYLSHKSMIILGAFGLLATYLIIWYGQSLLAMQLAQVTYAFGMAAKMVFSSYLFLLVAEENYQTMTSLTTAVSLLSFMFASILGQLLVLKDVSYGAFFLISISALSACCALAFLLPKDHSLTSMSHILKFPGQIKEWPAILKETWNGPTLQILSLWWAIAYAGISLVQNYGTNLFDAIDSQSKFNGHIMAASLAMGSLGSYCAIYIEQLPNRILLFIYLLGSAIIGIICVGMGISVKIWAAYVYYVAVSGIYQMFACLVSVQCGKLLSNGQYILLFSVNNVLGLMIETILQAAVEAAGFSIFSQFIAFSGLFFLATVVIGGLLFTSNEPNERTLCLVSETEHENHITNSN